MAWLSPPYEWRPHFFQLDKKRILFSIQDFKSARWTEELNRYDIEVLPSGVHLYSEISTILNGFFTGRKIDLFVFRYLNDHHSFLRSIKYVVRDVLIILLCKVLGTRILWIMHNVDRETVRYHEKLNRFRRWIVNKSADRILVTDPHLVQKAQKFGVRGEKLGWTCFGAPEPADVDDRNKKLLDQIKQFKNDLNARGFDEVCIGLCVSNAAEKKNHYLEAYNVAGVASNPKSGCVGLVMIGNFPAGADFEYAKSRVVDSPFILYIDKLFPVNEWYIRDHIDFFYRSMTDQSVAYTIYVACTLEKPVVTHNTGALSEIVKKEDIGIVIDDKRDIPGDIIQLVRAWKPDGAKRFLKRRSWRVGATKIHETLLEGNRSEIWKDSTISNTKLAERSSD